MTQARVLSFIDDLEYRDYNAGEVVDFPDTLLGWLKSRKLVDDTPSVVSAAIAGGAVQKTHSKGSAPGGSTVSAGGAAVQALFARSGIESARAGISPMLIALLGDSNTTATGAGTGTMGLVGARLRSTASQLADVLNASFMSATDDAFWGDGNATAAGVTIQQYDSRISAYGAGWSTDTVASTLGGRMIVGAASAAGAFTFTPRKKWNRAVLFFGRATTTASSVTVKANGTSMGTANTRGAAGVARVEFSSSGAAAVQPLSLDTVSADGSCFLAGGYVYDSDNPGIVVMPCAWYGATVANLITATQPWLYPGMLAALAPHLSIINLTINDCNTGTLAETYASRMSTLLTPVRAAGDLIITGGTPSNNGNTTGGLLDQYMAALSTLNASLATGFDVVDWRNQFGSTYSAANAEGWMYDGNHVNGKAMARQVAVYADRIKRIEQFAQ